MSGGNISPRGNFIGAIRQISEWSRGTNHGDTLEKNIPGRENSKYKCPETEEGLRNKKKAKDIGIDWVRRIGEGDKDLNPAVSDSKRMSIMLPLHHSGLGRCITTKEWHRKLETTVGFAG